MKTKFISLVLSVLVSGSGSVSLANAGLSKSFEALAAEFSSNCLKDDCERPLSKTMVYPWGNQILNENIRYALNIIAKKQAQIWGDTILEGDYVADGNTHLDEIRLLQVDGKTAGYLITYSEKAWNISDCLYDGLHPQSLSGCVTGRIVESSYVSLDYRNYFYDDTTSASFK